MFGFSFYYARAKKTLVPCAVVPWFILPGSWALRPRGDEEEEGRSSDQGRGNKAPLWVGPGTEAGVRGGQWQPYNPRAHRCWGTSPLEESACLWNGALSSLKEEGERQRRLASRAELHFQAGQGRHLVAEAVCRAVHSSPGPSRPDTSSWLFLFKAIEPSAAQAVHDA